MATEKDVAWVFDKAFTHEETGLCVIVKRLALHRPRFSMEVCVKLEGERYARYLPGHVGRWGETDFGAIVGDLVTQGQSYIVEEIAKRAEIISMEEAERARREQEKRQRHQNNVEARRVANREATSKNKGKRAS